MTIILFRSRIILFVKKGMTVTHCYMLNHTFVWKRYDCPLPPPCLRHAPPSAHPSSSVAAAAPPAASIQVAFECPCALLHLRPTSPCSPQTPPHTHSPSKPSLCPRRMWAHERTTFSLSTPSPACSLIPWPPPLMLPHLSLLDSSTLIAGVLAPPPVCNPFPHLALSMHSPHQLLVAPRLPHPPPAP